MALFFLPHINFNKFFSGICKNTDHNYIIMEYCEKGSLRKLLTDGYKIHKLDFYL